MPVKASHSYHFSIIDNLPSWQLASLKTQTSKACSTSCTYEKIFVLLTIGNESSEAISSRRCYVSNLILPSGWRKSAIPAFGSLRCRRSSPSFPNSNSMHKPLRLIAHLCYHHNYLSYFRLPFSIRRTHHWRICRCIRAVKTCSGASVGRNWTRSEPVNFFSFIRCLSAHIQKPPSPFSTACEH